MCFAGLKPLLGCPASALSREDKPATALAMSSCNRGGWLTLSLPARPRLRSSRRDQAFQTARKQAAQALIVVSFGGLIVNNKERVVNLAIKNRLPAMYNISEFVHSGGLISYDSDGIDRVRRAASYVDKILKGTKPADLPVQQPTKFEFVINLKSAKQIGLTVP